MTGPADTDTADPVEVHRGVVEGLDGELFKVTTEPIGWRCRQCGGPLSLTDPASTPAWRQQGIIDSLIDSADYHLRADHNHDGPPPTQ